MGDSILPEIINVMAHVDWTPCREVIAIDCIIGLLVMSDCDIWSNIL